MKISRDVITDLLPAYLSGEASDDTKNLVDHYLEENPEFAAMVRSNTEDFFEANVPIRLTQEDEMKALERTKKLLGIRSSLLGAAIFLTLLPFSMYGDENGIIWIFKGQVVSLTVILSLAATAWIGYLATRYRLRTSGL